MRPKYMSKHNIVSQHCGSNMTTLWNNSTIKNLTSNQKLAIVWNHLLKKLFAVWFKPQRPSSYKSQTCSKILVEHRTTQKKLPCRNILKVVLLLFLLRTRSWVAMVSVPLKVDQKGMLFWIYHVSEEKCSMLHPTMEIDDLVQTNVIETPSTIVCLNFSFTLLMTSLPPMQT